jgi:hypothetical protein
VQRCDAVASHSHICTAIQQPLHRPLIAALGCQLQRRQQPRGLFRRCLFPAHQSGCLLM